jgi:hypothetical protein
MITITLTPIMWFQDFSRNFEYIHANRKAFRYVLKVTECHLT